MSCSRACRLTHWQSYALAIPGRGPHSIIGPIAVNKAEPGDVLEILLPIGATIAHVARLAGTAYLSDHLNVKVTTTGA
jgi:acetamidase/formamidase